MNIAPINYNQNIAKTQMSQPKFGTLKFNYVKFTEFDPLSILASKFPIGTQTVVNHIQKEPIGSIKEGQYSHTEVAIEGLSQKAEDFIERVLDATGVFVGIKKTPCEESFAKGAIIGGLDELGVSELEPGLSCVTTKGMYTNGSSYQYYNA